MKFFYKLAASLLLAAAALFSTQVLAQGKVYIEEGWESETIFSDVWDPNYIDGDLGRLSGGSAWLGWVYDPDGIFIGQSIPETITGLRKLQSNPFTVTEDGSLVFSMDLWYFCNAKDSLRQFGVRIAEKTASLQWDTIFLLRQPGETLPATSVYYGKTYSIDTTLGDKYNGKEMVFQIFFYNSMLDNSPFMVLFDNVYLRSYASQPQIKTEITSFPYLFGNDYNLKIKCKNFSLQNIKNVEYGYSVTGIEKTASYNFAFDLWAGGDEQDAYIPVNLEGCEVNKTYTLALWPKKLNGADAAFADTVYFDFEYVDENILTQQYVPLMECFTSAYCNPCRTMNNYLNPVLEELKAAGKMNIIKYQMNFPGVDKYYIENPNKFRGEYYNVPGVPSPIYCGQSNMLYWMAETYEGLMDLLREKAEMDAQNKALMNMEITKAVIDASTMKLELEFNVTSAIAATAKVYAMALEGTTTGNRGSNGEKEFHWVTMKAVIASNLTGPGVSRTFAPGQVQNFSYTTDMSKTNVEEADDLQVVCFVQENESGYIYQSVGIDVLAEGVDNEKLCVLPAVKVYPNPASKTATVSNLENASVQIFDMNGRTVYKAEGVSGNLDVNLRSFRAGTYFVNVAQNGRAATRKLVVVK